jgi:hypothetical protein
MPVAAQPQQRQPASARRSEQLRPSPSAPTQNSPPAASGGVSTLPASTVSAGAPKPASTIPPAETQRALAAARALFAKAATENTRCGLVAEALAAKKRALVTSRNALQVRVVKTQLSYH